MDPHNGTGRLICSELLYKIKVIRVERYESRLCSLPTPARGSCSRGTRNVRARAVHALFRMLHVVKVVVVAFVCLIIGFSARQLFDAYAREKIPFLRVADPDMEIQVITVPPEAVPLLTDPLNPPWSG